MIANPGIPAYRYGQPGGENLPQNMGTYSGPQQPHGGEHPKTLGTSFPHPGAGQAAACSGHRQARGSGAGEEVRRGDERQPFTPAEYKHFDKYL